jgi:hypothetical protein
MGLLLTLLIAGCGSDGGGSSQPGTLGISMTDAPACGFDAVNVTVSKVRVHQSSSVDDKAAGWTDITLDPPRTINLLDLNDPTQAPKFALESLGETPLPAGHYTQLRLVLVPNSNSPNPPFNNSVVLSGTNTPIKLDTPSGMQSGIKLIHQFTMDSGQRVDLLLDFDACKSIVAHKGGTYKLKPVIQVIPFVLNGIEGFVGTNLLSSNFVVSAQVNGEIVRATVPNTSTGKFFLARLPAGAGVSYDVVITADSHATAVISGVPVPSSTSITTVSTSGAPIPVVSPPTLEASATHDIGGTVTLNPATDDAAVLVAAKQALNGGLTVTVNSRVATVNNATVPTGDYEYNLTLPIGAPSLGPYITPLPIVFVQQPPAVAGHYIVQASATDYTTQSVNADISAADATQNFILTP